MTENNKLYLLAAGAVAAMLVAAWAMFLYAPQDALQGPVQRIFYLHVGSAVAAFGSFALVLAGGVAFLWKDSVRGDRLGRAAALVGLVFTTNTFVMGMIWAKPIWNWDPSQTWDARLTSTAVLWVIYAGYLLVRRFATPGRPAMRLAAVVGIVGFADVPIVYFSVQWWRTLHPGPVLAAPGGPQLPPEMLVAALVTTAAVLLLAGVLIAIRYRIETRRDERDERAVAAQLELSGSGAP
ncbi:MAG TPA: cytochrome c biogenesis protein CcsA [Candidatus Dormibacteraeota bacterium]|nr:cytochrome c biogenesis protein CcsA [Candidatus Dormibacteraeota bacterium]